MFNFEEQFDFSMIFNYGERRRLEKVGEVRIIKKREKGIGQQIKKSVNSLLSPGVGFVVDFALQFGGDVGVNRGGCEGSVAEEHLNGF